MERWRFIASDAGSPAYNMAVDEAILEAHSRGLVPPTVRFYTWSVPTLTIGYFQKARREVNFTVLNEKGFGFVRRPTGGRAVLHDRELTYSVVVRDDHPFMPGSVNDSYRVISQGLQAGFQQLNLGTEMVYLADDSKREKFSALESAACFDSPSWYELVVEGRKIAGSAQTRSRGVILQHGSILIELDVHALFDVLLIENDRLRKRLQAGLSARATALADLLPSVPPLQQVQQAFFEGFQQGLSIQLHPDRLTPFEEQLAQELIVAKYETESWNFRR